MKSLKEIIFIITPFIVTCFITYLLGAFSSASWSPLDWTWISRITAIIWGMCFGFMLLIRLYRSRNV